MGDNGGAITVEIGVETSLGTTVYARRHATLIGNIYESEN